LLSAVIAVPIVGTSVGGPLGGTLGRIAGRLFDAGRRERKHP
jgi:hypothetical protein